MEKNKEKKFWKNPWVVGIGLLLISVVLDLLIKTNVFSSAWTALKWIGSLIVSDYLIPGWVLVILILFALFGLYTLFVRFRSEEEPDFYKYKEDNFNEAIWRWEYNNNRIKNLWCFCPICDTILVSRVIGPTFKHYKIETIFICENCEKTVTKIKGKVQFAKGYIERKIDRKIRTKEYLNVIKK